MRKYSCVQLTARSEYSRRCSAEIFAEAVGFASSLHTNPQEKDTASPSKTAHPGFRVPRFTPKFPPDKRFSPKQFLYQVSPKLLCYPLRHYLPATRRPIMVIEFNSLAPQPGGPFWHPTCISSGGCPKGRPTRSCVASTLAGKAKQLAFINSFIGDAIKNSHAKGVPGRSDNAPPTWRKSI